MRTKKALINFLSGFSYQIINIVIGLFLPILFIRLYGSEINGMRLSISQFVSYLYLVEAGVGAASIAALYAPLAENKINKINGVLSATRLFYNRSGLIFLSLTIFLSLIYPLMVQNQVSFLLAFCMVIFISSSGIMEYFFVGKYKVILIADQKNHIVSLFQICSLVLSALVSIIGIKFGLSILVVQMLSSVFYIIPLFGLKKYIRNNYVSIDYYADPNKNAISQRWDALIHQIAALIVFNSPIIVITIICGLKEVSVYAMYNMVFSGIVMVANAFSSAFTASFGEILAKNDHEILKKAYDSYEDLFYMIITWLYVCTSLLTLPFIKIYTSGIQDANYYRPNLMILFVLVGLANTIRIPQMTLVNAAGHFKQTRYKALLESLLNIIASCLFAVLWGLEGVLIGSICSYLYRTTDFIIYNSKYILKRQINKTLSKLILNAVLFFICLIPFKFFIIINISNFKEWIIWGTVIALWSLLIIIGGNFFVRPKMMKDIFARFYTLRKMLKG